MRVLHAAAELFPYVKVGGLGDVMASLPRSLRSEGADARLLLPGYPELLASLNPVREVGVVPDLLGMGPAHLRITKTPCGVPLYLVDHPLFNRPGGPYEEHGDSHLKFGAFSWMAAHIARHGDGHGWNPEILHIHDWQTGLAPVYLDLEGPGRPRTVLTIHNLAYQGLYGASVLGPLHLPPRVFHMHGVEFYGNVSFLKGGIQSADRITTVSPTYAQEIQTPAFGEGLDGLLRYRAADLVGILNGVDSEVWNPGHSPHLPDHYSITHPSGKRVCKNRLQQEMGLDESPSDPLFGVVSRMAYQKGLDLLLESVDTLVGLGAQLVILGSGDKALENGFAAATERYKGRVAVNLGYDEPLANRVLAGSDVLVVPSRFEPCGLTQLYALAYGALPLVRRTGGLADTVVDADHEGATGFHFEHASALDIQSALRRVVGVYRDEPKRWTSMQRNAMKQDFGWRGSAKKYIQLYQDLLKPTT
jgi:starch synthase